MTKKKDGVDKLNELLPGGGASQQEQEPEPLSEEEVSEKTKKILDLVAKLAEEDVFLMQDLMEACNGEIQSQIRELFLGEEGEDDVKK